MNQRYGWTMVAVGALMGCVAVGAMLSLAVFLQPISESTGWSRAAVSSAMTIGFLAMGAGSFGWGVLSDRFGARPVTFIGAILLGAGLVLSSFATGPLQFALTFGLLVGGASGSLFIPMMALVTSWFDQHRSLAVSLVSVGVGVAPMTVSPFAAWLLTTSDWRHAQFVIGVLVWVLLIPATLLVRQPPAAPRAPGAAAPASDATSAAAALRSTPFIVLAATFFACCATHAGPIFHTISYAIACGVPALSAVSIYSLEGFAGLGGRLVLGIAGDRYGAKRVLIAGLLIQAVGAAAFVFASRLSEFYLVAAIFGFAYGGVMPLYAVLARDYFGQHIMGTVLGAASMISSLGMAAGPVVGGWLFDTFGSYGWLYAASAVIGVAAVGMAFAFPRPAPALAPRPA